DTANITITVSAATIPVIGVSVTPTSGTITEGNTQTLTATITPSNASNTSVSWSSSNTGVATVSTAGVVTGVSAGTATISVTTQDGNHIATSIITVQAAIITFDPSTGEYRAPAGSTVTVILLSEGMGSGYANINISSIGFSLSTEWNGIINEEFVDSDTDSFIMPASGLVTFAGSHNSNFGVSFSSVAIANNQGTSRFFSMDVSVGMPQ
ncbi:Ig-like domain-containing protein, partial [uncultured Maribacter sp.]|uniref:Ig-like domain-containing protein n=1 Tax=uncultured Maribacter sp. TaxID=431308 RepID=UPI002615864F